MFWQWKRLIINRLARNAYRQVRKAELLVRMNLVIVTKTVLVYPENQVHVVGPLPPGCRLHSHLLFLRQVANEVLIAAVKLSKPQVLLGLRPLEVFSLCLFVFRNEQEKHVEQ